MARRVRDEGAANYGRARRLEDDAIAEAQDPGRSRLIPRHLLKYCLELGTQLIEHRNPLSARSQGRLLATAGQAVEFVACRHQNPETRELGDVSGELAECARLRMWTPIVFAVGNALEHASSRRELRFQIRKE